MSAQKDVDGHTGTPVPRRTCVAVACREALLTARLDEVPLLTPLHLQAHPTALQHHPRRPPSQHPTRRWAAEILRQTPGNCRVVTNAQHQATQQKRTLFTISNSSLRRRVDVPAGRGTDRDDPGTAVRNCNVWST